MGISLTGGKFKGHKLVTLKNSKITRPSSSKLREALFNILGSLEGKSFIDLFAGYGTVGLEAMSRSADSVDLVESNPKVFQVMENNAKKFPGTNVRLWKQSVESYLKQNKNFDIIFMDPPFTNDFENLFEIIQVLRNGCPCIIVQFPTRTPPLWVSETSRVKKYGESSLGFFYN